MSDNTGSNTEIEAIDAELFRDDVYRASRVFAEGQTWLDVGCHVGLFTKLALLHGASVVGGVDADPAMCDAYTDLHEQPAVLSMIDTAEDVITVLEQTGGANALKMDIQGSEIDILSRSSELAKLSAFDTLLFEYHQPESLVELMRSLTRNNYVVDFIDATTDSLMVGHPTFIVHAVKAWR